MRIRRESVYHYCRMMRRGEWFSFAGYSDAEWRCCFAARTGEWAGTRTGLGQVIDGAHGRLLLDVLTRRAADPHFMFAVPRCLWPHQGAAGGFAPGLPGFAEGQVDWLLGSLGVDPVGWERDDVLDDLARDAGLFPWIREFRRHQLCLIGPAALRGVAEFLPVRHYVEVETPNLHLAPGGIEAAVRAARAWAPRTGHTACYLVSAGVSAAVLIDRLHDPVVRAGRGWCLDMGSVWDGFVGAGGQRAWRAALYADPAALEKWKSDNLTGKDGRGW